MSESKEFLGKTLDAAIADACAYYDVPREKLEIDIIEDAKTGIFGIVGARKAKIVARLAVLPDFSQFVPKAEKQERRRGRRRDKAENGEALAAPEAVETEETVAAPKERVKEAKAPKAPKEAKEPAKAKAPREEQKAREELKAEEAAAPKDEVKKAEHRKDEAKKEALPAELPAEAPSAEAPAEDKAEAQDDAPRGRRGRQPRPRREAAPRPEKAEKAEDPDALESSLPRVPLAELDQERLLEVSRSIIGKLVGPILDLAPEDVDLTLEVTEDRLQISVKSEDTGLLIGRDGQNLAAVQYLASRMITRAMGSQVRIQVDAGDYHVRQDSRLQELALALAEKVKATGKVQTTRPLSAYQRRVIHLALQDDPEVQTRSSGEGALKHVVILRRKD